jgi:hypothetical protein
MLLLHIVLRPWLYPCIYQVNTPIETGVEETQQYQKIGCHRLHRARERPRSAVWGPPQQLTIRSLEAAQTTATDLTWEQVPCIIYLPILPA